MSLFHIFKNIDILKVELFVFIKLRFKIDFSGTLTLLIHFFVSLMKLVDNYIARETSSHAIFFLIGINMIVYSLCYFTCELMHIKTV